MTSAAACMGHYLINLGLIQEAGRHTEIKKPPVAPKPKFAMSNNKPAPPPVAPKPDVVISSSARSTKKPKPAIAPKPKVLKDSPAQDLRPSPSRKNAVNQEEHKQKGPANPDDCNGKTVGGQSSSALLPPCTCGSECLHKLGNRGHLCGKQLIIEPLEMYKTVENSNIDEFSLSVNTRNKCESPGEKVENEGEVVLKAGLLEETPKDVLSQGMSPFHLTHKHSTTDTPELNGGCSSNKQFTDGLTDSLQSSSSIERAPENHHLSQPPNDEFQKVEMCQDGDGKSSNCCHPSEQENLENSNGNNITCSGGVNKESEVSDFGPLEIHLVTYHKKFPTPKPRKTRIARLIRQRYIDAPSASTEEPPHSDTNPPCLTEDSFKNSTSSILPQSASCDEEQVNKVEQGSESELNPHPGSDRKHLAGSQKAVCFKTSIENVAPSLDTASSLSTDLKIVDDCSLSLDRERETSFLRCNTLSMSLPNHIKLTYKEHLPSACNLGLPTPQLQKEPPVKNENSLRIIPKKPQRHSLPAAGVLKKAASEELVEKSSYPLNEGEKAEESLERIHLKHDCTPNPGMSSSFDVPKQTSEKPVWKLPHPILPFSGNPESLKSVRTSLSASQPAPALTKPRAKSLSAVDVERSTKSCKEPPKKNSFKKLLNLKLSVCFMKSDFQKFWSKSSQLRDTTTGKKTENDWHGLLVGEEKRGKPVKAHSADNYSLESQKKKKSRGQSSIANGPRAESLDDQMLSRETSSQDPCKSVTSISAPEYENINCYAKIPEYENLPFVMVVGKTPEFESRNSSSTEDTYENVYEIQDPYEASAPQLQLGPTLQHCSSGASHEAHSDLDLGLDDLPSDEEEVSNSSDEDDVSSESSKGEPDLLGEKQGEDTRMKCKVHHIAKEITSSEKVFVDVLKLLHIDFRDAVAHASRQLGKPVIEDRILNQILYYLPQLYELNRDLLKELEERMLNWTEQQRIADIFVKKGPYLKMYSTYIKEFDKNIALLDEQSKKNPGFAAVLRDFEMSPRCANLALKHYLLKPVQRIPQYRLLLTDYLKNLLEDSGDYRDTQDALAVVIEVANHANDTMKQGDNFQKLMQIQYSLNGHHEIVQPGRVFLKEGTLMKLSRKVMQPRMFFLFNDALLYTTPVQSGMFKLNNMLSLAGMKVRKPTQEAYQNELKIESVERSFILSASSAAERDEWLEAISRSIEEYAKKRITFYPSRSLDEADSDNKEEVSPLGSKAPIWVPDTRVTMCMICTSEFTLTWRRHHCRACGKIVCQACSSNKYGLDYLKNQPARVCEHCFQELQKLDHQHSTKIGSPGSHKSPSSALSSVLQSIPSGRKQKKIPAALKEVSANTEDSSMSGYLYRSKGNKKPWKHLWFVIKNKVLYTYAASEDVAALESQPLLGFTVSKVKDENSESKVFQLLHKNMLFYVFKAEDAHSAQKWIEAFQEGTIL
ncbi:PREDICTED: FYVE, RhoGEF and PH domain-containing protein 6 [Elephantulus edwardii]|uniref:FYVE, RhoGEF and PH domain-containing protein 6 n=1 Tax=Elephantulus edwardii TaxID=28737 RepID=UPI0003F0C00C|nr:PREDICTED: FYVE, RhoGEF and PH domain-containing protein 6 [Elephantulus edwardii]